MSRSGSRPSRTAEDGQVLELEATQHAHLLSSCRGNSRHMERLGYRTRIGRRITAITEDTRETVFLFQRLSMALQQENAVAFQNTMSTE